MVIFPALLGQGPNSHFDIAGSDLRERHRELSPFPIFLELVTDRTTSSSDLCGARWSCGRGGGRLLARLAHLRAEGHTPFEDSVTNFQSPWVLSKVFPADVLHEE